MSTLKTIGTEIHQRVFKREFFADKDCQKLSLEMINLNMSFDKFSVFLGKVNVLVDKFLMSVFSLPEICMLSFGLFHAYDEHFESDKGRDYFMSMIQKLEKRFVLADFSLAKKEYGYAFLLMKEQIFVQFVGENIEAEEFDLRRLAYNELEIFLKFKNISDNEAYDFLQEYIGKPEQSEPLLDDADKFILNRYLSEGLE